MTFLRIIILCFLASHHAKCARILGIFPTPAYSHQAMARPIMLELQAKGHDIVMLTTAPLREKAPPNYKEIDLSFLNKYVNITAFTVEGPRRLRTSLFYSLQSGIERLVKGIYAMDEVQDLIKSDQHFDLLLLEWSAHPSLTAFSERFNCPMIGIRSLGLRVDAHDVIGNPVTPYQQHDTNFYGRFVNTMMVLYMRLIHKYVFLPSAEHIAKLNFPNHTTYVGNLEQNVSLMFISTHPIITGPRPYVPSVIEIGGLHVQNTTSTEIPLEIKQFLDEAKQGAILFSLGTLVSFKDISKAQTDIFMEAFSELPYNIICKSDVDLIPTDSKNIRIFNWLPQVAILNHPNVHLFVTHGGLHSIWESVVRGVPIIGIPFHSDQFYNVKRMKELGIGLNLDMNFLNKETIIDLVNEIMTNSSYRERTAQIAKLIKDEPMKPLDKAIWWIEYVLRHGGAPHFKSDAVGMHWYIYYSLDVITVLIIICLITIIFVFKILKFLCMFCRRYNKQKLKNN